MSAERPSKGMALDVELADTVLTHVGGCSLFRYGYSRAVPGKYLHRFNIFDQGLGVTKLLSFAGYTEGAVSICSSNTGILIHTTRAMEVAVCTCQRFIQFTHKSLPQLVRIVHATSSFPLEHLMVKWLSRTWDPGGGSRVARSALLSTPFVGHTSAYSKNDLLMGCCKLCSICKAAYTGLLFRNAADFYCTSDNKDQMTADFNRFSGARLLRPPWPSPVLETLRCNKKWVAGSSKHMQIVLWVCSRNILTGKCCIRCIHGNHSIHELFGKWRLHLSSDQGKSEQFASGGGKLVEVELDYCTHGLALAQRCVMRRVWYGAWLHSFQLVAVIFSASQYKIRVAQQKLGGLDFHSWSKEYHFLPPLQRPQVLDPCLVRELQSVYWITMCLVLRSQMHTYNGTLAGCCQPRVVNMNRTILNKHGGCR